MMNSAHLHRRLREAELRYQQIPVIGPSFSSSTRSKSVCVAADVVAETVLEAEADKAYTVAVAAGMPLLADC